MKIVFFVDIKNFQLRNRRKIRKWVEDILNSYGKIAGEIKIVFTGRNTILRLNKEFLKHNYITDVITFIESNKRNQVSGEIYICVYQVKKNAKYFNASFQEELRRVIGHGILHLLGYKDYTQEEKIEMKKLEEKVLSLW